MQIVQCCVALVLTSCYNTIGTNHKACHLFLVENLFWQYRRNHELDKRRLLWVVLSILFDVPFCVVFLCVFGYVPTCNAVAACNSIACEGLVVLSRLCVVPFANCNAVAACNSMTKRRLLWLVFVPFCVVFGYVSACNAVATRILLASWACESSVCLPCECRTSRLWLTPLTGGGAGRLPLSPRCRVRGCWGQGFAPKCPYDFFNLCKRHWNVSRFPDKPWN